MSEDNENIIYVGDMNYDIAPGGLGKEIYESMKRHGDSTAQIDVMTGKKDSFKDLLVRSVRTAIGMKRLGVKPKDVVVVTCYNHLNTCVPVIASLFVGAVVSITDPKISLKESVYLLRQLRSKLIFADSSCEELLVEAIKQTEVDTKLVVHGTSNFGNIEFKDSFLGETPEEEGFEPFEIQDAEEDLACILFSSGSTGYPKGICLSHYAFQCQLNDYKYLFSTGEILSFMTLYWISKLSLVILSLLFNAVMLIYREFDENVAWNILEQYQVYILYLSPYHALKLLRAKNCKKNVSVKLVIVTGNRVSEELMVEMKKTLPGAIVIQAWAMTETVGRGISFSPNDFSLPTEKLNRSLGTPSKGVWYKIVDVDTGKALGPNQPGELCVKSKIQMNGYFGKDSSDIWDENGYLKTGDMMYYDEDLCFYYVERIGEMFKYRSVYYVYPNLLEDALMNHPAVSNAAVVGLEHPEDEIVPAAMVTLREDCDPITPQELRKYVETNANNLAPLSGGITIVKDIPTATSGKIRRKMIKELLLKQEN